MTAAVQEIANLPLTAMMEQTGRLKHDGIDGVYCRLLYH